MVHLISHSEIEMLGQCEKKHYYAFTRQLQSKSQSIALQRGNAGHAYLETFLSAKRQGFSDSEAKHIYLEQSKVLEIDLMPRGEALGLVSYWVDNIFPRLGWKVVEVEKEFRVPVSDEVTYPFKCDVIVETRRGLFIVDHKFTSDPYSDNAIAMIPQIPRYMAGLVKLGIPIKGGIYNFFRTRKINDPESRYVQKEVIVSQARLNDAVRELKLGFDRVIEARSESFEAIRTANKMNCDNCGFWSICHAELEGNSTRLMEKVEYEPNTYGYKDK